MLLLRAEAEASSTQTVGGQDWPTAIRQDRQDELVTARAVRLDCGFRRDADETAVYFIPTLDAYDKGIDFRLKVWKRK